MSNTVKIIIALVLGIFIAIPAYWVISGLGKSGTIRIATKPMTEQFILGEMLALLIEEKTGLKVEITKGIGGGTANIHPAILKGEFDLYPEYTGTAWNYVLKETHFPDDKALYDALVQQYRDRFRLEWVGMYGFNNTYGLALRREIAEKYGIETYSQLASLSADLRFGGEYDFFEREDGYDALCKEYGYAFGKRMDLDIGLKYGAITDGQVDVMNIFTTDGQLRAAPVRVLRDDRKFYRTYYCGTVVHADVLHDYPELRDVLMMMDGLISEGDMALLNYVVEKEKRSEREVAREFLQMKKLID